MCGLASTSYSQATAIHNVEAAAATENNSQQVPLPEPHLFAKVLDVTSGNQSKTAEVLGKTRGKVRDRIATFAILFEKTVLVGKTENGFE